MVPSAGSFSPRSCPFPLALLYTSLGHFPQRFPELDSWMYLSPGESLLGSPTGPLNSTSHTWVITSPSSQACSPPGVPITASNPTLHLSSCPGQKPGVLSSLLPPWFLDPLNQQVLPMTHCLYSHHIYLGSSHHHLSPGLLRWTPNWPSCWVLVLPFPFILYTAARG